MPHLDTIIRKGEAKDARAIADIGHKAFKTAFRNDRNAIELDAYIRDEYNKSAIAARVSTAHISYLIAEHEGVPIGFAELWQESPKNSAREMMKLERLYLDPRTIGQGVGHSLLMASEAESQQNGLHGLWLMVLRPNDKAMQFYRQHGYSAFGESPGKFKGDAEIDIWMKKTWG